jgi:hypothetical protein
MYREHVDVRLLIKQDGVERGLIKAVERLSEDKRDAASRVSGVLLRQSI